MSSCSQISIMYTNFSTTKHISPKIIQCLLQTLILVKEGCISDRQ